MCQRKLGAHGHCHCHASFFISHTTTSLRGIAFFSLQIIIMLHNNPRLWGAPPTLCCTSLGGCDDLIKVCGYWRGDFMLGVEIVRFVYIIVFLIYHENIWIAINPMSKK
jgi:hypothetical protein